MKRLYYIKTKNKIFTPQVAGIQNEKCHTGTFLPVCFIKRLMFGCWQIDYYDEMYETDGFGGNRNQTPNTRIILFSSGIEEIRYILN